MPLTDTTLRNAKPRHKPYKRADGDGLYVLIHPNGSRYWRLKYRYAGKEKLLAIGVYPETGIAAAREKAVAARQLLREGHDPMIVRRTTRARNISATLDTFEVVAAEWMAANAAHWSPSYADKIRSTMASDVFPRIGSLPITKLDAPTVRGVLTPIEARGALESARKTRKWIAEVFRHGIGTGRITLNPVDHIKLAKGAGKHFPHLKRHELGDFLRKLSEYTGRPETRIAVKLLLLTFVRTGEMRPAQWTEFDLDADEWRIPDARMKMGHEHVVPLARQTVALLKELKQFTGYSPYLFPGSGKHRIMSEGTVNKAIAMIGYKGRVVGHGFRGTARTILSESGQFSREAMELQLAHGKRDKVEAAYDHAEFLPKRRRMMQWWADFLDASQRGAEVVPMKRHGN